MQKLKLKRKKTKQNIMVILDSRYMVLVTVSTFLQCSKKLLCTEGSCALEPRVSKLEEKSGNVCLKPLDRQGVQGALTYNLTLGKGTESAFVLIGRAHV